MRTQRKFLAWMIALFLLVSFIPTTAMAAEPEDENGETPVVCAGYEADETCPAETHVEGCPLYVEPRNDEDAYPTDVSKEVHENESNLGNDYNADDSTIAKANSYPVEALENNDVNVVADYSWYSEYATEYHLYDVCDLLGLSKITRGEASGITQTSFEGKKVILAADIDLFQINSWTPISSNNTPFCGEFDGGDHTISNLKIEEADNWSGLFSAVGDGGNIHDITIENPKIVGATGKSCIGALSGGTTGSNGTAIIENCKVNSNDSEAYFISGTTSHIGGLLGVVTCGTVKNCYSNIKVVGGANAGGLAGLVRNATISNCQAHGEIDGLTNQSSYIGGLIGSVEATDSHSVTIQSNIATGNFSQVSSTGNKGDVKVNGALIGGIGVKNSGTATITGNYACGQKMKNEINTCEKLAGDFPDSSVIFNKNLITNGGVVDTGKTGFLAVSKVGYIASWYTDTSFSAQTSDSEPQDNFTYYAKWTLNAPTVEVTADKTNVVTGTSVTLTANAEHELEDVTYAYQWYQGDTAIEGATEASYITGSLTADAAYSCAVTASRDGETSEAATGSVEIKVSAQEGTLTLSAASGEALTTAGQVSLTYAYNGDGTVTASSSEESVAAVEIDQTAKKVTVTVKKAGTAVITVSAGATETYTAASAEYQLTVKEPAPVTPGGSSHSGSSSTPTYAVTVDSGRHGTVTVSPKSARKGAAVTITVKPDDGYELDGLTVTDASGKAVKVTEGKNGKFTFTMPASKVEVDATFTAIKEETPAQRFNDVPNGYWAEDAIAWAAENGCINGNTAATFNPEGTVTRQQLWMILARLSGYQPADFTEARAWAVDNSISDGANPGGAVSRQQLVAILYRYAVRMGYDASGAADLTAYPDHASVAAYAADAMAWSVANGIVGGTAQGTLAPTGTATRAQFAVILMRFADKTAK